MIEITDINDPRIEFYRSLRYTPKSHTDNRIFITEGEKVTLSLLNSDLKIISFFALPEYYEKYADLIKNKIIPENNLFSSNKKIMEQIVGYNMHSGIMALARQPEPAELDELQSPVIILNKIIDAENVGSIIRNCAGFGINSIIVDSETANPYLRRAVRVSMGNVMNMKIHYSSDIIQTVRELKREKGIISAEITPNSKDINSFRFPENFCLIFGSEGHGVDKELLDLSDYIIHIPMSESVPSLNVAASTAVFLYKISADKSGAF